MQLTVRVIDGALTRAAELFNKKVKDEGKRPAVAARLKGDLARNPVPAADLLGLAVPDTLEDGERAVIARALARTGGNASAAARNLGISRATFHRKLGARATEGRDLSQN